MMVRVTEIHREGNGHRDPGDLRRLAGSIQNHGIKVPLCVYRRNSGYGLIDGAARLAAAEMVGLAEVPAEIVDEPERTQEVIRELLTKLRREDLDALGRAREYSKLVDLGCTQRQIGEWLNRNPATISQEMALLRLIPELQEAVRRGQLPPRAGYHLAQLSVAQQKEAAQVALEARSTRRVEAMVRGLRGSVKPSVEPTVEDARHLRKRLRALKSRLPLPEPARDELEPVLMQIDATLKEIWRMM